MGLHCTYCGNKNDEDAVFCSECGKARTPNDEKKEFNKTPLISSKKTIVIVSILVGLLFGGAIGFSLAPESAGRGEKPSVMNLIKGSYYDPVNHVLRKSGDPDSHISTALRKGREYLFLFSLLGACTGGLVGYGLQRRKT
ncbi:zinc-ribbon domain-containing protein [Cohnella abietis]|uniref:Zinc-ribbon domain-containing protein n=1 Tax=Cohnella abietis TaxID=2507935 RepID=A0A3T1CY60_9BACL|nr:zinc-ribbon domain-containing protein [Cohnella abietis]BBI30802.1 hypothetical protein KCTCHS21_02010 [Cohnella abietis]